MGRRADDARLLPWREADADAGRERLLLLVIRLEADEGRLWGADFFSDVENVDDIITALDGRLGRRIRGGGGAIAAGGGGAV